MPRPATGTIERAIDASGRVYFRGKVRLLDGTRARVDIDDPKCFSETASRDYVAWAQEQEDETHTIYNAKRAATARREAAVAGAAGESSSAWFARYSAYQKELGHTDVAKKAARWAKWIAPLIGDKPIVLVTKDDIEDVRDSLDRAIDAWRAAGKSAGKNGRAVSGKTAMNAWSCLTSSFKAACSSKRRDLRAREDNPCKDVEPPGDRDSRQSRRKTFLYPKEAAALLACETIEIEWREIYAVALMTYLRPGELRVLTVGDVAIDDRLILVTKAWDYEECRVKPPKTRNGVRRVPIEPALLPLLARLVEGRDAAELVVPALDRFSYDHLAEQWRKHLLVAGVERAELHTSTGTHVQSNFRSCRDSGLTWLALLDLDVAKIMRRAGHDHVQTTMGYVKLAEDLTGDLGVPFAPLPSSLVARDVRATLATDRATQSDETPRRVVGRDGVAETATFHGVISHVETSQPGFDSLLRHSVRGDSRLFTTRRPIRGSRSSRRRATSSRRRSPRRPRRRSSVCLR